MQNVAHDPFMLSEATITRMRVYFLLCLLGSENSEFRVKGELQRENKLISYERAFKMLDNDMYIAGIGQAVLELLSFKVESGNHQRGISFRNFRTSSVIWGSFY